MMGILVRCNLTGGAAVAFTCGVTAGISLAVMLLPAVTSWEMGIAKSARFRAGDVYVPPTLLHREPNRLPSSLRVSYILHGIHM